MKKAIITAIILNFAFFIPVSACTTLLVTKGASKDGSVIVAHSDDSELFDQRLVYVPAGGNLPGPLSPATTTVMSMHPGKWPRKWVTQKIGIRNRNGPPAPPPMKNERPDRRSNCSLKEHR